jgi:hypothetical protein
MRHWSILAAITIFSLTGIASVAHAKFDAGLLDISFGNKDIVPDGKYVLGADGDKWNTPEGEKGEKVELTDAKGEKTDANVTYAANGTYDAPDAGFVGTPFEKLLRKYLHTNDAKQVTVAGLTGGAKYTVVLYSASNANERKTKFTIGSESKTTTYDMEKKELADGINYATFTATADADGNLVISYEGVDGGEGNLNGLQIEPAK